MLAQLIWALCSSHSYDDVNSTAFNLGVIAPMRKGESGEVADPLARLVRVLAPFSAKL